MKEGIIVAGYKLLFKLAVSSIQYLQSTSVKIYQNSTRLHQ